MNRITKRMLAVMLALCMFIGVFAQTVREITGTVTDADNEPLIGVSVVEKGTTNGTISDIDGHYTLSVKDGALLSFSFMGLASQEIEVEGKSRIDVKMLSDEKLLDELVVTALGIKKDEKVLGYAMQQVGSEELTETGNTNVMSALEGKVAGVEITSSATGLGGTNKISIRGNSSIAGNNNPLWVVDGIPFNNNGNGAPGSYGGYDRGNAAVDINMDDIETISVLKGPAASALYGSLAGNGVIIVTTKRGAKKEGVGVDFSAHLSVDNIYGGLDMQNKYGRGNNGIADKSSPTSWGGVMDGKAMEAWTGESLPYSPQSNRLNEFYRTGLTQLYNLAVGKGDAERSYRFGTSYMDTKGTFPNQGMKRLNVDMSGSTKLNKYLSVDSKMSLSETKTENRIYYGAYGTVNQLLLMPRNIRMRDLQNYSSEERQHINWTGGAPTIDLRNPYYVAAQYNNLEVRDRAFGYVKFDAKLHDWVNLAFKQSIDFYTTDFTQKELDEGLTPHGTTKSAYAVEKSTYKQINSELLLTGQKMFEGIGLDFSYVAGANRMHYKEDFLMTEARNLYNMDFNLGAGQDITSIPSQTLNEKEIQSVFGSAQLYYKSMLNLEMTARNDWSSALPKHNNSYFYPSVNLGFIGTGLLEHLDAEQDWLSFAKLRLSWAQVGKDCAPHLLENKDHYERAPDGKIQIIKDSEIKLNSDLKPELTTSQEVGLDLRFFKNRLGLDFTYYNSYTDNQVLKVDINKSSGYKFKHINAGRIQNNGVELALYATVIERKDFSFDMNLNLAHRKDFVKELNPDQAEGYQSLGDNDMIRVIGKTGQPLGQIVAKRSYKRDAQGRIVISPTTGLPVILSGAEGEKVIGNIQPDFNGSLRTSFAYKGFILNGLFNFKKGGDIVSVSESVASYVGTSLRTENREDFVVSGVKYDYDDSYIGENDIKVSAQQYYQAVGSMGSGVAEEFLYDASFVKLSEVALGYSFPPALLERLPVSQLKLSLVGRNLLYLYQNTPGTIPDGGFDLFSQAHDFSSIPNTRSIGFSLSASF